MAKKNAAPGEGVVAARVLRDCWLGKPNDIIELDSAVAVAAELDGAVDTNPAAIEAARAAG